MPRAPMQPHRSPGAITFRRLCNLVQQRHELRHVADNRMRTRCTERRGNALAGSILLVGRKRLIFRIDA